MFRGRFAPLSRFGLQSRGLTGTGISTGVSRTPCPVSSILCSNRPKGKNSSPAKAESDNRPFLFDASNSQWSAQHQHFLRETDLLRLSLMMDSHHSAGLLGRIDRR